MILIIEREKKIKRISLIVVRKEKGKIPKIEINREIICIP